MRYVIVKAQEYSVHLHELETFQEAVTAAGLNNGETDHGIVWRDPEGRGIAIVVHEFSLYVPPEEAHYFSMAGHLYSGNAVVYAFDQAGDTVDMPEQPPPVTFYKSHKEVEAAIQRGSLTRPYMAVNDEVLWEWPQPRK